jgi:hypothetical protein
VIVSSNLTQERLGSSVYQHWYAELRNEGATTLCYPELTVQFQDAGGVTLVEMYSFADTAPYKGALSSAAPCLAPGATGAVWDIQSVASEAAFEGAGVAPVASAAADPAVAAAAAKRTRALGERSALREQRDAARAALR